MRYLGVENLDPELQDEIEGLTDSVIDEAIAQQRANLEILRQREELIKQQQAVGAAALGVATEKLTVEG